MLKFTRKRRVTAVEDYEGPTPWLKRAAKKLSKSERAQLVHVVQLLDPSLDEKTIFAGSYRTFENANGITEVPLEWWDVEDDAGRVRYQLWIYCVDGAQLFEAGTTKRVAYVSQGAFWGDGFKGDSPGSLADQLDKAQALAVAADDDCELAMIEFIARV